MARKRKEDSWQSLLGLGLCLSLVAGPVLYWVLGSQERNGASIRLPIIIAPIYEAFGRLGIALAAAIIGALLIALALRKRKTQQAATARQG
jgi:hypothetical protein